MNINDLDKLDDKSHDANSELVGQEALRRAAAGLPQEESESQEIHEAVLAEVTELADRVVKEIANDAETLEQDGANDAGITGEFATSKDEQIMSGVENSSTETISKESAPAATLVFKKPSKLKSTSVTKDFLNRTASPKPLTLKKSTSSAMVTNTVPSQPRPVSSSVRSRLVTSRPSKSASGGTGSGSFGLSGTTSVKTPQGEVWGKNKPAAAKTYTDEELSKQLGIHLAQRLEVSTKEANNKWDEMDDDLFDLDTIEFGDGTKVSLANDAVEENTKTKVLPEPTNSTDPVVQQAPETPPVNPWKPIERTVVPLEIPIQSKPDDRKTEKMISDADASLEPKSTQKHTKEERFAEDSFDRGSWRTPALKPSLYNYEKGQVQEYHTGGARRRYSHTPSEGRTESVSEGKSGILARGRRRDSHSDVNHDHIKSGESGDVRNFGAAKEEVVHHRATSNTSSAKSNHAASGVEADVASKQTLTSPVLVEEPIKETVDAVAEQQAEMRRSIEAAKARKGQEQVKQLREEEERRQRAKARADALAKKQAEQTEQAKASTKVAPAVSNKPSRAESKRKADQVRNSTAPTTLWTKPSKAIKDDQLDVKKQPFVGANRKGSNNNSEVDSPPIDSPKKLVWGDVGSGSKFAHIGNGSVDLSSLDHPKSPPQELNSQKGDEVGQPKWPTYGDKDRSSIRSHEGDGGEMRRPFTFGSNTSLASEGSADSPRMSLNPISRTMAMNPLDDIISPKSVLVEDEESRRSRFFPRQEMVASLLNQSSQTSSPWRNLAVSSRTPLFDDSNSPGLTVSLPLDQLSPSTAHARVHLPASPNLQVPLTPMSGRMTPPRFSESADLAMARIQALLSPQPVDTTAKLLFSDAAFGAPVDRSVLQEIAEDSFSLTISPSEVELIFPQIEFGSVPLIALPNTDGRRVYGKGMVPLKRRDKQWSSNNEDDWKLFQPIRAKGNISIPLRLPFTSSSITSNLTMPAPKAEGATAKLSASATSYNTSRPLKRPSAKTLKSKAASFDRITVSNADGE